MIILVSSKKKKEAQGSFLVTIVTFYDRLEVFLVILPSMALHAVDAGFHTSIYITRHHRVVVDLFLAGNDKLIFDLLVSNQPLYLLLLPPTTKQSTQRNLNPTVCTPATRGHIYRLAVATQHAAPHATASLSLRLT